MSHKVLMFEVNRNAERCSAELFTGTLCLDQMKQQRGLSLCAAQKLLINPDLGTNRQKRLDSEEIFSSPMHVGRTQVCVVVASVSVCL